jgi:hypothetical protein
MHIAHILELGSPVQELGYLSKNFDPGAGTGISDPGTGFHVGPGAGIPEPGTMIPYPRTGIRGQDSGFRARELGLRTGSSQKRLGIGTPNPRTNLDRTDYREVAPGPIQELLRYLGPRGN